MDKDRASRGGTGAASLRLVPSRPPAASQPIRGAKDTAQSATGRLPAAGAAGPHCFLVVAARELERAAALHLLPCRTDPLLQPDPRQVTHLLEAPGTAPAMVNTPTKGEGGSHRLASRPQDRHGVPKQLVSGPASHRCMSCSLELRLLLRQRGSRAPTAPWGRVGPEPSQREPGTPEHAQGLTAALSWDGLDPHLSPAPTFRCAGGGPTRPSQQAPTPSPGLLAKSPCQRPGPQSFWSCLGTQLTPCRPDQWHRPPGGVGAYSTTQSAAGTVVRLGRRVSGTEVYLRGVLTVGPGPLMLPAPPQGRTEGGLGRKLVSPTPCLWSFYLKKNKYVFWAGITDNCYYNQCRL